MTQKVKFNKRKNNNKKKNKEATPGPSRGRLGLLKAADMAGSMVPFGLGGLATTGLRGLANHAANWLGLGGYKLSRNSLVTKPIPGMHSNNQSTIIRHREYISDIVSPAVSGAFGIQQLIALNPGLEGSFPWLSSIASSYTEYTWRGLIFEFVSTSGDWSGTSQTLGTVSMATQYNLNAPLFQNKQVMLNEYFANDSKCSEDFIHPIECDPKENPFQIQYVRSGAVPAGQDPKLYDIGQTVIAVQGVTAGNIALGELWVSYEVELRKPVPSVLLDGTSGFAHYQLTSGYSQANPLGTSPVAVNDTIGLKLTNFQITFPTFSAGTYQVTYVCGSGTAASITEPTIALVNCSYATVDATNGYGSIGTAVQTYIKTFFITINGPLPPATPAVISFGTSSVLPASPIHVTLLVDQIPYYPSQV